jgi:hypothetical protein
MITEVRRLMADPDFWRRRSEGLAIFMTADRVHAYQLPVPFEEGVTVANRFRVKPLMPLFMADGRFYLLALSQAAVRLFDGPRHSALELEAEDLPGRIEETLGYDSKQSQLLDLAALETIRHDGQVYTLESGAMPARDTTAAAIQRF